MPSGLCPRAPKEHLRVCAVEPDPALARQLRYNVRASGLEDRVTVVEAAVGAAPGRGRLSLGAANSGENRLLRASEGGGERGTVSVRVTTLAEVVREARIERIDALKVDVEGREAEVLQPFLESAPRELWPRGLIVEMKERKRGEGLGGARPGRGAGAARSLSEWIAERGYRLAARTRLNGVFELDG